MILRRFTKHITDQNWFAVSLDVIVVVVGIFLGMMVTDWNDQRQLRGEEGQYLLSIRADIETSIIFADEHLNGLHKITDANYRLIQESKLEKSTLTTDEMDQLVYHGLYDRSILRVQQSTLDEMKSSGKFSIINNIELRKTLQNPDVLYQRIKLSEKDDYDLLKFGVEPYLINNYNSLQFIQHEDFFNLPNHQKQYPVEPLEIFTPLLKNREFINYVIWRYNFSKNAIGRVLTIKTEYQNILDLLDQRIVEVNNN